MEFAAILLEITCTGKIGFMTSDSPGGRELFSAITCRISKTRSLEITDLQYDIDVVNRRKMGASQEAGGALNSESSDGRAVAHRRLRTTAHRHCGLSGLGFHSRASFCASAI
jgi:hypothetical protein